MFNSVLRIVSQHPFGFKLLHSSSRRKGNLLAHVSVKSRSFSSALSQLVPAAQMMSSWLSVSLISSFSFPLWVGLIDSFCR